MNEFDNIIKKADMLTNSINNPNWISSTSESTDILTKIIQQEEQLENIKKGQTILDLGSGNGTAAFLWAYNGYNAIGIEVDHKLYKLSKEIQQKYPELKQLKVQFYNGSFYPIGYKKTKKTRKLEQKLLKEFKKEFKNTGIYLIPFTDTTYIDNNIDIRDVDIFYAYSWSFQFPSIYEMFYNHARDDAKLIAIGPGRDNILTYYQELAIKGNSINKK